MADKSIIDDVADRLEQNLQRADALRAMFDRLNAEEIGPVVASDLLRAAVVLLHAALEDVVRSIEEARLPDVPTFKWNFAVPSLPYDRTERITMQQLLEYRGKTVEDVFQASVRQHFERTNYNNVSDLFSALARVGMNVAPVQAHADTVAAMMKRRHWIVHRADRSPDAIRGRDLAQHISSGLVAGWSVAVRQVGVGLVAAWRKA